MSDISVERDLLEEIHKLNTAEQKRVLDFTRLLARARVRGVPGIELLPFAGTIVKADLQEMTQAITEGCEKVDPYEW